jgi:hypothetical protein
MAAGLGYKEFATGDVLTAADANGYLASQVVMVFASAAARTSAITSPQEGMISYLKDTNATEYYSGSAWVAVGAVSAPSFVGCSLYDSTSTQSISNNTSTLITWNSENFDTNTYHSTSTNTSRITIPTGKAGYYLFTSYGFFDSNATGNRRIDLRKNGSLIRSWPTPSTTSTFSGLTMTCILSLAEADYIEIAVFQNSGGALDYFKGIDTGNQYGSFECQYLGA